MTYINRTMKLRNSHRPHNTEDEMEFDGFTSNMFDDQVLKAIVSFEDQLELIAEDFGGISNKHMNEALARVNEIINGRK